MATRRSGFSQTDLSTLQMHVKLGVSEGIKDVVQQVTEHEIILRGADKESGLVKDVSDTKTWREKWGSRIIGYGAGAGLVSGVIFFVLDLLRNHGGK